MPYLSVNFTKKDILPLAIIDADEKTKLSQAVIHAKLADKVLAPLDEICMEQAAEFYSSDHHSLNPSTSYCKDKDGQTLEEANLWSFGTKDFSFEVINAINSAKNYAETVIRAFYAAEKSALAEAFVIKFKQLYQGEKLFKDGMIQGPYINGVLQEESAVPVQNLAAQEPTKPQPAAPSELSATKNP